MKKFLAVLCFATAFIAPALARQSTRPDGEIPQYDYLPSNPNICMDNKGNAIYCPANIKTKPKKSKETGQLVLISVATGAVVAGAAWYLFKKKPSEVAPGQITLKEF